MEDTTKKPHRGSPDGKEMPSQVEKSIERQEAKVVVVEKVDERNGRPDKPPLRKRGGYIRINELINVFAKLKEFAKKEGVEDESGIRLPWDEFRMVLKVVGKQINTSIKGSDQETRGCRV